MNLKKLSNEELDQQLKSLVKRENELLKHILLHIAEVDRRKMYLEMSYPSLFTYLTKHIGYSNGSAQRRIDAARLSYDVPGVINDIASGTLNLQQVSLVQASIRQVQTFHRQKKKENRLKGMELFDQQNNQDWSLDAGFSLNPENQKRPNDEGSAGDKNPITKDQKAKLIDELKNKSNTESQAIVAKALNIKPKTFAKVKYHQDESVTLELNLKKSQWEKLQKVRDLASHSLPSGSWDEVIEYAMDLVIRQKTYQEKKKSQKKSQEKTSQKKSPMTQTLQVKVCQRRSYTADADVFATKNQSQSHCHSVVDTSTYEKLGSQSKDHYRKAHYQLEVENLNSNENQFQTHCHSVVDTTTTHGKIESHSKGQHQKDHYQMAVNPEHEPKSKPKPTSKTLTPKLKQFILARDLHCQHVDPKSGKICASTQFLQVDHIHPRWDHGSHAPGNLRVLCGAHNRWRYLRETVG